jgi:NADH:quinone reductase (non-electrogenic)
MSASKRVVILGAGFAGLNLAKRLRHVPVDVVLIDKHNYHLFQPLLYQVATAGLSPADIAYPIRSIFSSQKNVLVALGLIDRIEVEKHQVCGQDVCIEYDYLAVCVGAVYSYFGHDAWRKIAPGLKDLDDATDIRRRVLLAFEEAELEKDEASRRAKLTFVVVGGGPTGVEMAGALREIAVNVIQKDFRHIDTQSSRIILIEGENQLLAQFDPKLGERAKRDLESMGVEVRLNQRVTDVDQGGVWIGDLRVPAENVIWAAGVAAPALLKTMNAPMDRSGRILVLPDLSVPGHPDVFVLGDAASLNDPKTGKPVPGLAPAAIQMGKYVAKIIREEIAQGGAVQGDRKPFHYIDKGVMATIGTHRAVAQIGPFKFGGLLAWLAWSLIHVATLIGFRNRLSVMLGWIYQYFTHGRSARLITGSFKLKVQDPRQAETGGAKPPKA